MPDQRGPAYRIHTPRLVVRCWEPADAPLLKEAVDASLDHLRPWMPWAKDEPQSLEQKVELLRGFRGRFDLGEEFVYAIFDRDESRVLGGTGLHRRSDEGSREIGYWLRPDATGRGLMTEAAAALTRVAFDIDGVDRVEIHCDPQNTASAAVPRRLGYEHEATLRRRLAYPEIRDTMIWTMFSDAYPRTMCAGARLAAFDVTGAVLLDSLSEARGRSRPPSE